MERNQNLCSRSTLPSFATLRMHHTRAKPPPVTGRLPPQASEHSHRNNSLQDFISHAIMQIIAREEYSPGASLGSETFRRATHYRQRAMEKHLRSDRETPPSKHCISLFFHLSSYTLDEEQHDITLLVRMVFVFLWYWWGSVVQSRFMLKLLSAFWLMTLADWLWRTKLPLDSARYAPLRHLRQRLNGKMLLMGGNVLNILRTKSFIWKTW